MPQDERWQYQYERVMAFMELNHCRPSRHRLEEHQMLTWMKHTKKAIAKGNYPADRLMKFKVLLEVADKYRRVNQYQ